MVACNNKKKKMYRDNSCFFWEQNVLKVFYNGDTQKMSIKKLLSSFCINGVCCLSIF